MQAQTTKLLETLREMSADAEARTKSDCDEREFHEGEKSAYDHAAKLVTQQLSTTIADDVIALHGRLHSHLTWTKTIDLSLGISTIEIIVYWRSAHGAHSSRQRIAYADFTTLFDYHCNLLRQAYLQTC
jgi:hypothetical protein